MSDQNFVTDAELTAALPDILGAPKTNVPIDILCFRPDFGQRDFRDRIEVTKEHGIIGERWAKTPWMKLPDGSGDPRIQVSILGRRMLDLVWRDRENVIHPGDTIIADLDTSEANLPAGQLLQIGSSVLRVTDAFNDACVKWKVRYGKDAKDFIVKPNYVSYRLRGALCEVAQDGVIHKDDTIIKI